MKQTLPKPPAWFVEMIRDALTDHDTDASFEEILERVWRRTCRGRLREGPHTYEWSDDGELRVLYVQDRVTIECATRPAP